MDRADRKPYTLMKHQSEFVQYALDKRYVASFQEMRLGKTLAYIRYVQLLPDVSKILVVAPISALQGWHEELEREGEVVYPAYMEKGADARLTAAYTPFINRLHLPGYDTREWVLLNYDGLRVLEAPSYWQWDAVVLDESTKIKNPTAKITKMCLQGFRGVPYRAILTGLPNPESELDFVCQFLFTHGSFMGCDNYWKFRSKYCVPDWTGKWTLKYDAYASIKQAVHEKAFIRRRKDCNIGSKKVYQKRVLDFTPEQRKEYRKVEREFVCGDLETQWAIVLQTWLSRLSGGFRPESGRRSLSSDDTNASQLWHTHKADEVLSLMRGELHNEKVVLWFKFNDELRFIRDMLVANGYNTAAIYGDTPVSKREEVAKSFFTEYTQVVCCQVKGGLKGLDLSAADTAIYYSTGWSMEDRYQSEDRIIHPRKTTPQLIIDLVMRDTVDEDVVYALGDKACTADEFLRRMRHHAERRAASWK